MVDPVILGYVLYKCQYCDSYREARNELYYIIQGTEGVNARKPRWPQGGDDHPVLLAPTSVEQADPHSTNPAKLKRYVPRSIS